MTGCTRHRRPVTCPHPRLLRPVAGIIIHCTFPLYLRLCPSFLSLWHVAAPIAFSMLRILSMITSEILSMISILILSIHFLIRMIILIILICLRG